MVSQTQFGLAIQNPVRVQRVAAVLLIGPERALLCRPGAGDVVAERRDERGVALAEQAERVWVVDAV